MPKNKAKNTFVDLEMADGSTVKLTLAYRWLLALSSYDKKLYDEYNRIYAKKSREELEIVKIVYVAYVCALLQNEATEQRMTWEQFLDEVTFDREVLNMAFAKLIAPKRVGDSETLSQLEAQAETA